MSSRHAAAFLLLHSLVADVVVLAAAAAAVAAIVFFFLFFISLFPILLSVSVRALFGQRPIPPLTTHDHTTANLFYFMIAVSVQITPFALDT